MVTSCSSAFGAQKVQLTEPSQAKHTFLSEGEQELSKRGHELIQAEIQEVQQLSNKHKKKPKPGTANSPDLKFD